MNNFAKKASKSERFNKWFVVESNEEGKSTRTKKPTRLLRQIPCRTQRYERSSLPYMTKLLSWHPPLPAPDLSMKWFRWYPLLGGCYKLPKVVYSTPYLIFQADYCGIIRCQINANTARHTSCIIYGLNEIHRQYINVRARACYMCEHMLATRASTLLVRTCSTTI